MHIAQGWPSDLRPEPAGQCATPRPGPFLFQGENSNLKARGVFVGHEGTGVGQISSTPNTGGFLPRQGYTLHTATYILYIYVHYCKTPFFTFP